MLSSCELYMEFLYHHPFPLESLIPLYLNPKKSFQGTKPSKNHPLRRRQFPTLPLPPNLRLRHTPTLRIQSTQIAIPSQTHNIHNKHAHIKRHELEVQTLHPRPDHEILGEAGDVGLAQAVAHRVALEVGHGGKEDEHVCGREEELVAGDARGDGAVGGFEVDVAREEAEPFGCGGAEDDCCVRC